MKKLLLLLLFAWGSACGQTYPAKPVKLIVTYPPGGSSDLMARVFGAKLSELWGQQVIVESKPGAAGSIGMDFAARQPPDGYSFVIGNSGPVAINPLLSSVPYSIEKDFVAVSMISTWPNVLVVRADSPHTSLANVISFARETPGVLQPAGTPRPIVAKLNGDTVKALADPDVKKKFADLGVEAVSSTPEQFAAFIRTEMDKYGRLIKEANIKVNP